MTQDYKHPIAPPPELVEHWMQDHATKYDLARHAAQWGADQELEECCAELESIPSPLGIPFGKMAGNALRAARRPKPPSLKQQALEALQALQQRTTDPGIVEPLRRALEQLPDHE
jgi:hypothetical protein